MRIPLHHHIINLFQTFLHILAQNTNYLIIEFHRIQLIHTMGMGMGMGMGMVQGLSVLQKPIPCFFERFLTIC